MGSKTSRLAKPDHVVTNAVGHVTTNAHRPPHARENGDIQATVDGASHANENRDTHAEAHPRLKGPIHAERHMKIVCVGAGASGLLLAYKLQRSFENFELVLYEKNEQISGTWFENKYPGCACDVPAHTYTWSFEPKVDWSAVYAGSDEIHGYFESFATKYGLHKYVKLRHCVTHATWDATRDAWDIDVTDLATGQTLRDRADILVNAAGVLNDWRWPDIEGLKEFKGVLVHTANWDRSLDLTGKRVGLIGNGSSAIQVLPAIQPKVAKLTTFIRRGTWVAPAQGFEQHVYAPEELVTFRNDPAAHLAYRKKQEEGTNAIFPMFIAGSAAQDTMFQMMTRQMREKLRGKAEGLAEVLIPQFGVGCRRITPGVGYLEALGKENVEVVYGDIERITERGCVTAVDGAEHELDVLICATGFNTSYMPRFGVVGEGGRSMKQEWAKEAKSYLGMAVAGFPNYFLVIGPNSPIGNGPVLVFMEAQIDYILKLANRWQTENIRSFAPKREAVEDFVAHKDQFMKGTVWEHDCRSWYKSNSVSGKVSALWPGSTLHYLEAIADPRYEDWEIRYKGNRFTWLGNGLSQTEVDATADWAYYVRDHDDSPFLGRKKALKVLNKSGTVDRREITGFLPS
ncbi:putative pyridine nucleotide-disulphide oxidoreductase [Lyophyllum shimeji]|uniref:Pyridine nucleotide-disulphide oxidoreductase n=1 Tax=Lyophyllum shimeji TaxID=47721 RepID=A0A9P3USY6_LYOSH|nr:putative pyridine nucleotide-disulphide oxidoreductase [Lyophyllum shimeji]